MNHVFIERVGSGHPDRPCSSETIVTDNIGALLLRAGESFLLAEERVIRRPVLITQTFTSNHIYPQLACLVLRSAEICRLPRFSPGDSLSTIT